MDITSRAIRLYCLYFHMSGGRKDKDRLLKGIPVSDRWREELIRMGKVPAEKLPRVREPSSDDLLTYLKRKDVTRALGLSAADMTYAETMAALDSRSLRRMGVVLTSGDYRKALAAHLEKKTGISLATPKTRTPDSEDVERRDIKHDVDPARLDAAERMLFVEGIKRPTWRDLFEMEAIYFAGVFVGADGNAHATTVGKPLHLVEDVGFVRVKVDDQYRSMQSSILPLDLNKGVMLPIVGDFIGKDGPLPDKALEGFGITKVEDDQGRPMTYPMFAHTARSLMQFCNLRIVVPVVDGRPRIVNRPEVMEDIYRELGGDEWAGQLRTWAEQAVEMAYDTNKPQMSREEFRRNQYGRAIAEMGLKVLNAIKHPAVNDRVKLTTLPCCAIQFKGAGCFCYDGQYVSPETHVKNPNLQLIKKRFEDSYFVVDKRFEGKRGILLANPHQEGSMDPVGGVATLEAEGYDREQRILENGGKLSGITIGVVKLLDDTQVPELCIPEVGITMVAVLDDTRRIGEFYGDDIPRHGFADAYKAFVVERYGSPMPQGMETAAFVRFVEEQFPACRERHLQEFMTNLGKTTRAVLESNLTNPQDQNLMGNISMVGGITDTRALAKMTNPNQAIGYITHLIEGLNEFGQTAGFVSGKIFTTGHFHRMLEELLGDDAKPIIEFTKKKHFRPGERFDDWMQAKKLVGLMTDAWVRKAGGTPTGAYHLSDREMVAYLNTDCDARKISGIDARTLETFNRHLGDPRIPIVRQDGTITLEDSLEPFRAPLERRLHDVPKIYENAANIERQIYGREAPGRKKD